ncbi:hypothetical protein ACI79D_08995 [Geodermatophilus sp. SYSU D00708]
MGTLDRGPWGDGSPRRDTGADFLGQQSSAGNDAGLELALARLIRWLGRRRTGRGKPAPSEE